MYIVFWHQNVYISLFFGASHRDTLKYRVEVVFYLNYEALQMHFLPFQVDM